jgi:uncharacterized damage-inducible protein DinB
MLSEKEAWWRPHPTSNSIGNLMLHLNGNVRQWIISGLGGVSFERNRNQEFAERGPVPRRKLLAQLQSTVEEAFDIIGKLTAHDLERELTIQGFRVTGMQALLHVTEHFAFHSGQIILITKMKRRRDLGFTQLPGKKSTPARRSRLPAL